MRKKFAICCLLVIILIGCGKNPVGVGTSPIDSSTSVGKYKTAEGTAEVCDTPSNTQNLSTESINNCSSALTNAGVSIGGPTSVIKLYEKSLPFCTKPLAPPAGYTGPTTGPDNTNGWYKYSWDTNQGGVASSGSSYVKTGPGDYYADSSAKFKSIDSVTVSKGSYDVSGYNLSYNYNDKYHLAGITSTKIGGYFRFNGDTTYNGQTYTWDWQWDFEQSTTKDDKSGKYSWYATYSTSSGSHTYSGNVEFKADLSGDGKFYINGSLYLTIHWNAGGKSGYYITSTGQKCDFGSGC